MGRCFAPHEPLRSRKYRVAVALADGVGSSPVRPAPQCAAFWKTVRYQRCMSVRRSAQRSTTGARNSWLHAKPIRSHARFG